MRKTALARVFIAIGIAVYIFCAATAAATRAIPEMVSTTTPVTSLQLTRTERFALGLSILLGNGRTHFTNMQVDGVRYQTCDRFETKAVVLVCCYNAEHDPDMLSLPALFEVRGGCQVVPNDPSHSGYQALIKRFPPQQH